MTFDSPMGGEAMRRAFLGSFLVILALGVLPAFAGTPTDLGDYVWYDENCDGIQNEGPDNGLNDVRVMFFRDYGCDGEIDDNDEIYDYDFTTDNEFGDPGYYSVPTISGFCFVAFLDTDYIPEGLHATTPERIGFVTPVEGFADADFGLGDCVGGPPEYACPKTASFWKKELNRSSGVVYTQAEINTIVNYALTQTAVFTSYTDMKNALNARGYWGSKTRAKTQLAALLLNLAAYKVHESVGSDYGLAEDEPLYLWWIISSPNVGAAYDQLESWYRANRNTWMVGDVSELITYGIGVWVTCSEYWGGCW